MLNPGMPNTLTNIKYEPPKTVAGKFVEQIHQVEEEGIRKIVVDPSMLTSMAGSMPSDVSALMQQMMGTMPSQEANVNSSLPPEAAALMQQMLSTKVEADPNAGLDMVRKRPEFLEKAIKDSQSRDRFLVDIENSSVLDLFIKRSTKNDVINTLKTLSKVDYTNNIQESIFYYTDIGLTFYFDENENDTIYEIEVDEKYRRTTTMGLKINDSLERAIELYGPPRMKSAKGAIWNRFSILMRDRVNEIMLIRLKIRD